MKAPSSLPTAMEVAAVWEEDDVAAQRRAEDVQRLLR
jgi:hypothetical protein